MEQLLDAIRRHTEYPENALDQQPWEFQSLKTYRSRFQKQAVNLCVDEHGASKRPILVIQPSRLNSEAYDPVNVHGFQQLYNLLYENYPRKSSDPMCRMVLIDPRHSGSSLNVTHEMLSLLLSYHQVMPRFLDILQHWGPKDYSPTLPFMSIRTKQSLGPAASPHDLKIFGRSGKSFEHSFGLMSVESSESFKSSDDKRWRWSVRPVSAYHSFDVGTGRSIWIMIRGDDFLKDDVKYVTCGAPQAASRPKAPTTRYEAFDASLAMVLLVCELAYANWHEYVESLDKRLDDTKKPLREPNERIEESPPHSFDLPRTMTGKPTRNQSFGIKKSLTRVWSNATTLASPSRQATAIPAEKVSSPPDSSGRTEDVPRVGTTWTFKEIRTMQLLEEKAKEAKVTLSSNARVLKELCIFYDSVWGAEGFPDELRKECQKTFDRFKLQLKTKEADFETLEAFVDHILETVASRKSLLNDFISFQNMEVGNRLARKTKTSADHTFRLSKAMLYLSSMTAHETTVMKIVTVLTFLFLPATFISTLMSTDIWKYDNNLGLFQSSELKLFVYLWVPFMAVTLIVAYAVLLLARRDVAQREKTWWDDDVKNA